MATYRVHATKNYTVMSNVHLRDKSLSLKAKGLLSVMLSLPETWDYTINGLVAICKENNTAVESALKELKQFGYLVVTKKMPNETESGRIEYEYDIYEIPQESEKQQTEKQVAENQWVVSQGVENSPQLSNKELITKQSTTDRYITYNKIIAYLNEKAHTAFKATSKQTQAHINARLAEGFTEQDFYTVIDKKVTEWAGTEFEQYLRPATLFGTKFEGYLNAPARERKVYGATGIQIKNTDEEDILHGIL